MQESKFKAFMSAVKTIGSEYGEGYRLGLRRHYHGEKFGYESEHQKLLALSDHRQELGNGYRDGFAGIPPKGFHGNTGNLNAAIASPADSQLQVRVRSEIKQGYASQAKLEGVTLSSWVLKTLNDAIDNNDGKHQD